MLSSHLTADDRKAFRVCADPNYLPYSNKEGEGFENKIAELLAKDLGLPIEYTWFPQRMGFIRNTLRAENPTRDGYKCDIVMGVPHGFELAITTKPYYQSTYALVYLKGRGLDDVEKPSDILKLDNARKQKLRIAVSERSPGAQWLAKYNMFEQMIPYVAQLGDPAIRPGALMEKDLVAGKIDAAIMWGPIAGLTARQEQKAQVRIIPMISEPDVKFHYAISAGVRFGEKQWRNEIDDLLARNAKQINMLLRKYKVPLADKEGKLLSSNM